MQSPSDSVSGIAAQFEKLARPAAINSEQYAGPHHLICVRPSLRNDPDSGGGTSASARLS